MTRAFRHRGAILLLGALAVTLGAAQQPVAVRLRDAVGDTIDAAERDSFRLFPNTAGFDHAVILAIPGPEFFAQVTLAANYTPRQVFFRITPYQLERIRFLVDNREYAEQQRSDSTAVQALASFWQTIEEHPLRNIAGEPAIVQRAPPPPPEVVPSGEPATAQGVTPAPAEAAPVGEPQSEPATVVVRLRDVVGDTIDLAERDSFRLFPNTTGFHHAVILALPGNEFFAEVTLTDADTVRQVYYRILPGQLERIRFLIDNSQYMAEQLKSDPNDGLTLASFWKAIEDKPLRNIAREPPKAQNIAREPTKVATAGEPQLQPVTNENRYNYTLHGVTLGSCVGGCLGSWTGLEQVEHSYAGCLGGPVYAVNHPVFWTAACGLTALGSTAGYLMGAKADRDLSTNSQPGPVDEGRGWRTGCAIGAAIPGLLLGTSFAILAGGFHYGRTANGIVNDPDDLTVLPMALTGLCIAVEVTTIGYHIGRSIDRSNAETAERKRRALGR